MTLQDSRKIPSYTTQELFLTDLQAHTESWRIPGFSFYYGCQVIPLPDQSLIVTGGVRSTRVARLTLQADWTVHSLPSLSNERYCHGSVYVDHCLFVFGGCEGANTQDTCECFDFAKNTWTPRARMALGTSSVAAGVVLSTRKVFAFAGLHHDMLTHSIQEYNIETDVWTLLVTKLPYPSLNVSVFKSAQLSSTLWIVLRSKLYSFETFTCTLTQEDLLNADICTNGGVSEYSKRKLFCSNAQEGGAALQLNLPDLKWKQVRGVVWALKLKRVLVREVLGWLGESP